MPEREEGPTLGELEEVVKADPGPESVVDSVREAMEAAEATEAEAGAEQPVESDTAETETKQPEGEQPEAKSERDRDEKGRFVAKDGGEKPEGEDPAVAAQPEPEKGEPAAETPDEDPEPLDPRPEWTLEKQEQFRKLPVEAQRILLDEAEQFTSAHTEAQKTVERLKAFDEAIEPRRAEWLRNGMDEVTAVRQLLALSDFATEKPVEFIQYFAQQRGIDIGSLIPQAQQPDIPEEFADDPLVQQFQKMTSGLQAEIQSLKEQNTQLATNFQVRQQQEQQSSASQVEEQITAFATETTDEGKLAHPYFQQVRPIMGALMKSDSSLTLKSAYDRAVYADPEVRAKVEAAQRAVAEREKARAQKEKATAAKKAGSSVSGTPGAATEPQPTGNDLRDQLSAAWNATESTPVI